MSRIGTKDFVGNRARLQRMRDAKLINGWVEGFFGNTLKISVDSGVKMERGDQFRMEIFGEKLLVSCDVALHSIELGSVSGAVNGSNAMEFKPSSVDLNMVVTSQVKFTHSEESARYKLDGTQVVILEEKKYIGAVLIDVSKNGIGITCEKEFERDEEIAVRLSTHLGDIRSKGTIRYCREDREREGCFRMGIQFIDMGRLDASRWSRFLTELY